MLQREKGLERASALSHFAYTPQPLSPVLNFSVLVGAPVPSVGSVIVLGKECHIKQQPLKRDRAGPLAHHSKPRSLHAAPAGRVYPGNRDGVAACLTPQVPSRAREIGDEG